MSGYTKHGTDGTTNTDTKSPIFFFHYKRHVSRISHKDRHIHHENMLYDFYPLKPHNLCFEQKYEKYQRFLSINFQFLEVYFYIYLNRRVSVMSAP